MSEENDKMEDVDLDEEKVEEPEMVLNENGEDITDWKALALKTIGIAKRYQTKEMKRKEAEKAKAEVEAKAKSEVIGQPQDKKEKTEFDLAEKAYLLARGIKENEFSLVLDEMKETGKSDIDTILNSKYFQEKRELANSEVAIPPGTNRSGNATRNNVDYWIQKGELPPIDQPKLRREVVNKRLEKLKEESKFTDTPVVS